MSGRYPDHENPAKDAIMTGRRRQVEELLLKGVHSLPALVAAIGVSYAMIRKLIAEVEVEWRERHLAKDLDALRQQRVYQFELVYQQAMAGFERSRQTESEEVVQSQICLKCNGTGTNPDLKIEKCPECDDGLIKIDGKHRICERCDGDGTLGDAKGICRGCAGQGKILIETRKTRSMPGEPAFLETAKKALEAIVKTEGSGMPDNSRAGLMMQRMMTGARATGDEQLIQTVESIFVDAPVDLIIGAKASLDRLRLAVEGGKEKNGDGQESS